MTLEALELLTETKEPTCVHHWKIETPDGPTAWGTCKKCNERHEFATSGFFYGNSVWEKTGWD